MEMLAAAWGPIDDAGNLRLQAQSWLKDQGYAPAVFELGAGPLRWLAAVIPWLHDNDHPTEDLDQNVFRVSMPASIEAFVNATVPGATRIEFCHADSRVVIHRGWDAIAAGCEPAERDTVIVLE